MKWLRGRIQQRETMTRNRCCNGRRLDSLRRELLTFILQILLPLRKSKVYKNAVKKQIRLNKTFLEQTGNQNLLKQRVEYVMSSILHILLPRL